ncbi:MAG: sugar phosphate isomerase/epimerase [Cyclobacteriaceae bacterium]|nr:sugar phosphate isomerase/epimerase [Cyclobacteriaceae bacterium SS2]
MHDLGFVSAILADNSFEEVIDFAAVERFKCVEMMCWPKGKAERRYAGVTHIDVDTLDKDKASYYNDYCQAKGVYVSAMSYYPNPLDPDPELSKTYVEHLKKVIKGAAMMGLKNVNTFIGRDPSKNVDENFKRFEKIWPELIKLAGDHGINVGIENCPMYFTNDEWPSGKNLAISPVIWERMFNIIPDKNFGLNYDPSHMIWQHMDAYQPIYDFRDRLHHIHLKDVKLYPKKLDKVGILANPLEYHSPKLPGLGDVNWSKFFAALTDVKYRGPVCIEVEDKSFEGSKEDIETSLLISRNYLSQFLVL